MGNITYRKANIDNCYAIAKFGYKEFFVSVNKQNLNALEFYISMGGSIIHTDEMQIRIGYTV